MWNTNVGLWPTHLLARVRSDIMEGVSYESWQNENEISHQTNYLFHKSYYIVKC